MKAQEYINQNYPCDCSRRNEYNRLIHHEDCSRKNLEGLNLRNLQLEGDLDLEGFDKLESVLFSDSPRLGKIKNIPKKTKLVYQIPQEYQSRLEYNKNQVGIINLSKLKFEQPGELIIADYPNLREIEKKTFEEFHNLTKLIIANCPRLEKINIDFFENLQELVLHNLPNLRMFFCPFNNLITLDLTTCPNLEEIDCHNNQLTEIKLPNPGKRLEYLNLMNNKFKQDLSFLSHLKDLRNLNLGNNEFTGSLEALKDLRELERLNISNTDIDSGLEYLSDSIRQFEYSAKQRPEAKVKSIEQELNPVIGTKKTIQEWKKQWEKDNAEKVIKSQKELITEKIQKIAELENQIQEFNQKEREKQEKYEELIGLSFDEHSFKETKQLIRNQSQKSPQQQVLDQTSNFLGAKRIFLNARQNTIKELQKCYDELAKGKYTTIEEVNKAIGSIGEIEVTLGIPKAIEGVSTAVTNCFKNKFSDNCMKAFHQYLTNDNKNILPCFDETYNSLIKTIQESKDLELVSVIKKILNLGNRIWSQEVKLFNTDYKVYEVDNSIWEGKILTIEEMKEAIISLSKNLKDLKLELEQEEREFRKWKSGESRLESEISSNEQNQKKLLKVIEELKQQIKRESNQEQEMTKLEQLLTEKEQQLEQLKKENTELAKQLLSVKEKELAELEIKLEEGEISYKVAKNAIRQLHEEIYELKNNNGLIKVKQTKEQEVQTEMLVESKKILGKKVILDEFKEQIVHNSPKNS